MRFDAGCNVLIGIASFIGGLVLWFLGSIFDFGGIIYAGKMCVALGCLFFIYYGLVYIIERWRSPMSPYRWILGILRIKRTLVSEDIFTSVAGVGEVSSQLDALFREAMTKVGSVRNDVAGDNANVTDQFSELLAKYSLGEMRAYLDQQFTLRRDRGSRGNYEYADLYFPTLHTFDRRFKRNDRLMLYFMWNSDWTEQTSFESYLNQPGGLFK